ncbi:uncharacterized protein LOC132261458 [Phlebotomus argentipes]|uniref:uncharacterized protein LOC132261458 n=1 Tax=Phlebotomus argentipes TaxID=94469 RepID=UPI0028932378|nr:uncharacterized protein LOC132261458 [Phlebotomus argentipes]
MSKRSHSSPLKESERRKILKAEALEVLPEDDSLKLPKGYVDSDAESEEDETLYTGMKDGKLQVRGKTLEQRLAKLVIEDNLSVSSTRKLLKILREYGHEDLPTSKTTLVKDNIDFSQEVMKVIKGIEKTLKAKLNFVMDQATKLESCLILPDDIVDTACKYNKMTMSTQSAKGDLHAFPVTSTKRFEKMDEEFENDPTLVRQVRDTIMSFPTDWMRLLITEDVLTKYVLSRSTDRRSIFSFKIFQYAQKLTNYHDVVHQFKIARDRHAKRVARKKKLIARQETEESSSTKREVDDGDEDTESA